MKFLLRQYNALSEKKRAALWFTFCLFMQKGISVITTPIFTRLLSTTEYGNYNVFNSWLEIVTVFVSLKLSAGVYLQGLVKFDERRDEFSSSLQGLSLSLTLLWTAVYLLFREFWNGVFSLTTVQMLAMLVMIWATAAFNFWATAQRSLYKYRMLVLITVLTSIAKPGIGILFVIRAQDKVTARILGLALVELIFYSVLFFRQIQKGKKLYSREFWRYALVFNLPLVPHYLSTTILHSADRIMIRDMVSADAAGIYSLSYQLSQLMTLFSSALQQSIQPWMYEKIKAKKVEDIHSIVYPAFLFMAGMIAMAMLCAPEILSIFAPSSYSEAIWVIPPVSVSVYFVFSYTMFGTFEFYYEKTKYIAAATIVGAVLNIILNYIFIKIFGYMAAGYTTLFCYAVFMFFHYQFMRKICRDHMGGRYPYETKVILGICGALCAAGALALATYNNAALRYSVLALLALCALWKRKLIAAGLASILHARKNTKA